MSKKSKKKTSSKQRFQKVRALVATEIRSLTSRVLLEMPDDDEEAAFDTVTALYAAFSKESGYAEGLVTLCCLPAELRDEMRRTAILEGKAECLQRHEESGCPGCDGQEVLSREVQRLN